LDLLGERPCYQGKQDTLFLSRLHSQRGGPTLPGGTTFPNSRICTCIYVSIANPRVFHLALHIISEIGKEFGLHTFPRTILRQLEECQDATLLKSFRLTPTTCTFDSSTGDIPKNFSLRLRAHMYSICGTSMGSRTGPLTPSAPGAVRAAQAAALTHRHPRPPILDEVFPSYDTALSNLPKESTPLTLPALTTPQHSPEDMDDETTGPSLDPARIPTEGPPEDSGPQPLQPESGKQGRV
jgi:hypothetical protein